MLSLDDALERLLAQAAPVAEIDTVGLAEAGGRVLARTVPAPIDVPGADNTQMDGYAVRAAEAVAGARLPVSQRIPAGHVGGPLAPGTAARIFTGGLIPPGADAVVMQEATERDGDTVVIREAATPGQWIRRAGEDIRAGSDILPAGWRLRPQDVGLAASVGVARLDVHRRVKVACFFTGDELVAPGEPLPPGAIYNSSRYVLGALLGALGCAVTDLGTVSDSLERTRAALRAAARDSDLIVTVGGVSVGEEDHVRPALEAEGELTTWQVAIKPGKPLAHGRVRREGGGAAHFIGLPGNPVSSLVTFLLFVRPFVLRLQGVGDVAPVALAMRAGFDWLQPGSRREFLRARRTPGGELELFPHQGSAVLSSAVWADGLVDNPPDTVIRRGDLVRFLPFDGLLH